ARARAVPGVLPSRRHVLARHLQWLSDDVESEEPDPGRGAVAAFCAQPLRTVRSACRAGTGAAVAVAVFCRHGGLAYADRRCSRRGPLPGCLFAAARPISARPAAHTAI